MNFTKCIYLCLALLPVTAFSAELNLGKSIEIDDEVRNPTEQSYTELVGTGYVCEIQLPLAHRTSIELRSNADCEGAEIVLRLCRAASGANRCPVSGDEHYTYDEARLALAVRTLQHAMDNNYRVRAYRSSYYSQVPDFDGYAIKFAHTFDVKK